MKNRISLCIWGDGPGRPYDNSYILESISYEANILHLCFQGSIEAKSFGIN